MKILKIFFKTWCPHTDSNREPTDYKSVALPIEHTISLTYKANINS